MEQKMRQFFSLAILALLTALPVAADPIHASYAPVRPASLLSMDANGAETSAVTTGWLDGAPKYHYYTCPVTGVAEVLTTDWVGYWGADDASFPRVGEVFYVHVASANVSSCANALISSELVLPPGLTPAVNTTYKLRCFHSRVDGSGYEEVTGTNGTNHSCPVAPSSGIYGWYVGWSGIPPGWIWDVWLPVVASREIKGIAEGSTGKILGGVTESGTLPGGTTAPEAFVVVSAAGGTTGFGATLGASSPADGDVQKGASAVVMGQFALTAGNSEGVRIESVSVKAAGSGHDETDITAIRLVFDANGNGAIDLNESTLAHGLFSVNDGTIELPLNTPLLLAAGATANILVAYDFNTVLGWAWPLAPLPLMMVGAIVAGRLRRRIDYLLIALAAIGVLGCGGSGGGGSGATVDPDNATFQASLVAVRAVSQTSGALVGASGLPLSGRTVLIAK